MATVSIYTYGNVMSWRLHTARRNEVSKFALCATRITSSPQNSKNLRTASSSFSAPATISSVIPVSSVIFAGMGFSGSTNVLKDSVISPLCTRTAPISVMRSLLEERPVVSRSKQM